MTDYSDNYVPIDEDNGGLVVVGGRRIIRGGETAYDFGFRRSEPEDYGEFLKAFDPNETVEPQFKDRVVDLAAPGRALYKQPIPYNWQLTGSCVNGGFFAATTVRIGLQIAVGQPVGSFDLPFTLFTYGQSRWLAYQDSSPGEGSSGAAMVQAAAKVGVPSWNDPDAPKAQILKSADGRFSVHVFSRAQELHYSASRNHTQGMKERALKVKLLYTQVRTPDEAEIEMRKGRPLTWAGNWGGLNRVPVAGGKKGCKVLLSRHASTWNHQQSIELMMDHEDLGRIWNVRNQWYGPGPDTDATYVRTPDGQAISQITKAGTVFSVHGDPVDPYSVFGSYWITDADMAYQCRTGEVFSVQVVGIYGGDVGVGAV